MRENIVKKKKAIVEKFESIKKQQQDGQSLLGALNSLVSVSRASPDKPKPTASHSLFLTQPEAQIFTSTTNVYNSLNLEGQHYAIVEARPVLPRSNLPVEGKA